MSRTFFIAGIALIGSLVAWAGVGYFATIITDARTARVADITNAQQADENAASTLRFKALVEDTKPSRDALDLRTHLDVVSIVNLLEATGKSAGATLQVRSAQPERGGADKTISVIGFVIEAQGSFVSIIQTLHLLETLPLAAGIEQVEIDHVPETTTKNDAPWHLSVHLKIITTALTSS